VRTLFATAVRRLCACQRGFTLIETMLVAATLSIIIVAILSLSDTSQKLVPRDQERAFVIREAQVGLHKMTRELRQASQVISTSPRSMEVTVRGQQVRYTCEAPHPTKSAWRRCVRTAMSGSTPGAQSVVVDRVLNGTGTVFSYTTDEQTGQITYVAVKLEVPASGDLKQGHPHRVALDDGFYMRNRDL
jgi:prepilin-type N-terminal cleavage/methylation domain-containing protein